MTVAPETTTLLWPFLLYGATVVILVSGIVLISYFLGERHKESATNNVYEGGIIATGTARLKFPVDFYVVALFFVIFDMAAVFIIAWAITVKSVGWAGYTAILLFIAALASILIYIRSVGAFDFGPNSKRILKAYRTKIKNTSYEMVDK
ncbi:MAG: NADH-quinone oxidoreductase subunit A [Bacteroidia bacterium]